jgi:hypothetical protein
MRAIALAVLASVALALPHDSTNGIEIERRQLEDRTTTSFGKFAILGDSFASGVSWLYTKRYDLLDPDNCRRYFQAYGPQLKEDGRLGPNAELVFLACSGSQTTNVLNNQIPAMPDDLSFATISVGENDIGFYSVMNACILRADKELTDEDCKQQIADASQRIEATVPGYETIYSAAIDRGGDSRAFQVYVLGYPEFFNADTDQCDEVSFAYYEDNSGGPFLTKEMRKNINGLIEQMNQAIKAAAESAHNDNIIFVNITTAFQGHRFCEDGIVEPYSGGLYTGIDDSAAWLYHFDWNPLHELDDSSVVTNYTNATFGCNADLEAANDAGAVLQCGFVNSGVTSLMFGGTLVEEQDDDETGTEVNAAALLSSGDSGDPGQYGLFQRTYHPTYRGHTAIKDAIFAALGVA